MDTKLWIFITHGHYKDIPRFSQIYDFFTNIEKLSISSDKKIFPSLYHYIFQQNGT